MIMLEQVGFGPRIVSIILECIWTPTFSFIVNGRVDGMVVPTSGLRQGCPLSPCIFLFVAEGFSALLLNQERLGLMRGFSC